MYIIAGYYRRHRLISPKGDHARPTASRLREAFFNICQGVIEGAHFLDLFAGSGAMGLEALSRGAQSATFVDNHKESIRCIQQNVTSLHVEKECQILQGDIFSVLKRLEKQEKSFDIIYADPPYQTKGSLTTSSEQFYSAQLIRWLDSHPSLLTASGWLFVEEDQKHAQPLSHLEHLRLTANRERGNTSLQHYSLL